MGVLVGRRINCPTCRSTEKVETKEVKESYMTYLTEQYLENFRAFLEAADLYLVKSNCR